MHAPFPLTTFWLAALCLAGVVLAPAALAAQPAAPAAPGGAPAPAVFDKAARGTPELLQVGPAREWCPLCGMRLQIFWKTGHAAHLHDGSARQYCSIACLSADLERLGGGVERISVVDVASDRLAPAATATYVVGSDVPGTMSAVSKLGFAQRADAEAFQKAHGGRLASFDEALAAARESRVADRERLETRRRLKVHPMGRTLWESACRRAVAPDGYDSVAALKAALRSAAGCPDLPEEKLQAVALYLWDVVRAGAAPAAPLVPPADAKCPVCGMFVAKYPHWVARARRADGAELWFDGVKDLVKYVRAPASYGGAALGGAALTVTDYYTLAPLAADDAFYVIGSTVLGPMGHEPVPLRSAEHAERFRADHGGERVLRFADLTLTVIEALDARR